MLRLKILSMIATNKRKAMIAHLSADWDHRYGYYRTKIATQRNNPKEASKLGQS